MGRSTGAWDNCPSTCDNLSIDASSWSNLMRGMLQSEFRFYLLGFTIAALEEFITQGVLKNNLRGWIIPTIIAFVPFLAIVRSIGQFLDRRLSQYRAALTYYLAAGGIGLAVEWFAIGLSPWSRPEAQPLAMFLLQMGMFSFWSSVAFAPRLWLDQRDFVAAVRRPFQWFFVLGMGVIYGIIFAPHHRAQFATSIV